MPTIITKNSSTASSVPTAAQLLQGELAVNVTDRRLFTENASGTVVELGTNPSSLTLPNGTANGVPYLNGSKVLTTGSALTFDTQTLKATSAGDAYLQVGRTASGSESNLLLGAESGYTVLYSRNATTGAAPLLFSLGTSEQMRLTSTGLGIGTSSPSRKLTVFGSDGVPFFNVNGYDVASWTGATLDFGGMTAAQWNTLRFFTSGSERARLDSSGNLGLGVTPSAWGGAFRALQIGGNPVITGANAPDFCGNAYHDGTNWRYIGTNFAARYSVNQNNGGIHAWFTAPSGTAGAAISFTQAMTLTAAGDLGLGTTSPFSNTNRQTLTLQGAWGGELDIAVGSTKHSTFGTDNFASGLSCRIWSQDGIAFYNASLGTPRAMTLDSSGNLLVGTTSASGDGITLAPRSSGSNTTSQIAFNRASTTVSGAPLAFLNGGSVVGSVTYTNTTTTYNTSSDYRLKENVQPMTGALAKVALLKPCTYKWKADGSNGEGFIAHELAEVVPQCVTGEKDAVDAEGKPVYQGIDTSFLVATLTAAIQEQQAIINQLTARIEALEQA